MRPIRLEVEGFTCYRERQTPLDFTGLSLFAIAGPTGAGKSSILDAMLYALYGEIPRLGGQGKTEIISQGRDAVSVCFDFEVQERQYRVTRRLKRRAKSSAQSSAMLAEITDGTERSLADSVRTVNEAVIQVLGLAYEDFTQTVVLPQGEFAKFLKAQPSGQREILQRLLRHQVFERMRESADARRRQLESERQRIEGQLNRCTEATEEALAARQSELAAAHARQAETTLAKTGAEEALGTIRRGREVSIALQKCRQEQAALESQAPRIEQARIEQTNARRAATVVPRLDACRDAESRLVGARREHTTSQAAAAVAETTRRQVANRLEIAATEAFACEGLEQKKRALDEIRGDLVRRTELTAAAANLPKALSAAERAVTAAQKREQTASRAVAEFDSQLQALEAELAATSFDEDLLTRLEALRDDCARARALDRDLVAADEELERCDAIRASAERHGAEMERDDAAAAEAALAATAARERGRSALDAAADRHRAVVLRSHLHVGEACPVCLHPVAELPPIDTPPELATLETALKNATARAQKAESLRSEAAAALGIAQGRLADAVTAVEQATARRDSVVAARAAGFAELAAAVAEAGGALAGMQIVEWMDRQRGEMTTARAVRERVRERQREVEKARADTALAHASEVSAATQAEGRLTQLRHEQARIQAELGAVVARIAAVTTSTDPQAERDGLEREVARLRGAVQQAQDAAARAERDAAAASERLQAASRALEEAEAHAAQVQEVLATALAECGFTSAVEASKAARSAEQQKLLERTIAKYDQDCASVQQRLGELEPQVAAGEITQEMLADAERRCKSAVEAWRDADQTVVRLDSECARLRTAVAERQQLLAARIANQRVLATAGEVATDLRSDRFQQYLLEEAFEALVAGASVRMKAISNRYTLEWEAGEFYVVDHDNAGERRRAETLSGGETFMASLCLALQLSEEVLRTSGALRMDSLFIDEGFGTLDVDALSEVTDAMEALRHDGNRMIGVISHRSELTDRLPGCVRVNKAVGESSWLLERVG